MVAVGLRLFHSSLVSTFESSRTSYGATVRAHSQDAPGTHARDTCDQGQRLSNNQSHIGVDVTRQNVCGPMPRT